MWHLCLPSSLQFPTQNLLRLVVPTRCALKLLFPNMKTNMAWSVSHCPLPCFMLHFITSLWNSKLSDVTNKPHNNGSPLVSHPPLSTTAQDVQSFLFFHVIWGLCALNSEKNWNDLVGLKVLKTLSEVKQTIWLFYVVSVGMDLKKKACWHFKVGNLVLILRKTMKPLRRLMTPDAIWRRYSQVKFRKHLIHMLGVPQFECGLALDQLAWYEYCEHLEPNYTFKTERSWHIPLSRYLRRRAEVEIIQSLYLIPICEKSVLHPKQYNWLVTGLHLWITRVDTCLCDFTSWFLLTLTQQFSIMS